MNLPNKLTILRVILIPFFVVFMLFDITGAADKWIALVIFCVASLTDMLDGKIARKYNCSVAEIVSLNRELIRDPALIYSGWELKVPQD